MIAIADGSLPSNVGGGGNVRNILRRTFSILKRRGWWDKLGMEGFLKIFEHHKLDLEGIYGEFAEFKSFEDIIRVEYDRWVNQDEEAIKKLQKTIRQRKGELSLEDWIVCMQSYGVPADKISEVTGQPIPGNLYLRISELQERSVKPSDAILYQTAHLVETENLYYKDHCLTEFSAAVVAVLDNASEEGRRNILVLDRSAVYPTSGGQLHDEGEMLIEGIDQPF